MNAKLPNRSLRIFTLILLLFPLGQFSMAQGIRPLAIQLSNVKHTLCGQQNGEISVKISGGLAPYELSWEDEAGNFIDGDSTITGLEYGLYYLFVTDKLGFTESFSTQILVEDDQTGPVFTSFPADIEVPRVDPKNWFNNISTDLTLRPTAEDGCSDVKGICYQDKAREIDCQTTEVTRTWTAFDHDGNETSGQQIILVVGEKLFDPYYHTALKVYTNTPAATAVEFDVEAYFGVEEETVITSVPSGSEFALGTHQITYDITSECGQQIQDVLVLEVLPQPNSRAVRSPLYLNAGGWRAYFSDEKKLFQEDQFFLGGQEREMPYRLISGINEDRIMRNFREGEQFEYRIPVEKNLRYRVTLGFTELEFSQQGQRFFDVLVEGQKLKTIDIVEEAKGKAKAVEVSFVVQSDDETLELEFVKGDDSEGLAILNGLSVVPADIPDGTYVNANAKEDYLTNDFELFVADFSAIGGKGSSDNSQSEISGTDRDYLHWTERYGEFRYKLSAEVGKYYDLTLYFAEIYHQAAGQRIFDVYMDDQLLLENFDIVAEAGAVKTEVKKNFRIKATSSQLNLIFKKSKNIPAGVDDNAKLSAFSFVKSVAQDPVAEGININADDQEGFVGGDETVYSLDNYFVGGKSYTLPKGVEIENTDDDRLFWSERFGKDFRYIVPVDVERFYTVTLYFAETFWDSPGNRFFNVDINGERKLSNFDIYREGQGANRAVKKTFILQADSTALDIHFYVDGGDANFCVDNAKVSALRIEPANPINDLWTLGFLNTLSDEFTAEPGAIMFPNPIDRHAYFNVGASSVEDFKLVVVSKDGREMRIPSSLMRMDGDLIYVDFYSLFLQRGVYTARFWVNGKEKESIRFIVLHHR
ncbi:malectin domain-containing carbohydrate-binding protein [Persicobacter psychrovividus]|uniref:Malectin domain-containing protein n=1 Tax=Persicobacter psychrovividus TaxID=387638 RepID=A0ABN6L7Z3_9BACT|nr:hypothetical protein PEPS_12240 [Persicobacter psychrovividus]